MPCFEDFSHPTIIKILNLFFKFFFSPIFILPGICLDVKGKIVPGWRGSVV